MAMFCSPTRRCSFNVRGLYGILQDDSSVDFDDPGLIATVPYGILSNKWGRHRVLSLAFSGITLGLAFQVIVCKSTLCSSLSYAQF